MDETVKSIISAALAGDSVEVKSNVEKAIGERVASQLEMRKIEIARDLIGQQPNMALVQNEDSDPPTIVSHSPWDKGVKKRNMMKKEDLDQLLTYVREEFEVDVEDVEELLLILEDMDNDDYQTLLEDFQESVKMPLGKNAKSGTYVNDFVHSKNKKFSGKSKKERIKMALGAFYGKKNEEVTTEGEVKVIDKVANDNPKRASKAANDNKPKAFEGVSDLANAGLNALLEKRMSNHAIAVKAHKGENVGHGGFGKVAASAAKEYGSKKAGERVAAAVMFKKYGKK